MKKQDLDRHLKAHGCFLHRQGEHEYWRSADGQRGAGVPRHREIKAGTVKSICLSLDIPIPPGK